MCNLTPLTDSRGRGGFLCGTNQPTSRVSFRFQRDPYPGHRGAGASFSGNPKDGNPKYAKASGIWGNRERGVTLRKHFHSSSLLTSGRKTAKGALCHGLHITAKVCESSLTVTLPGHTVRLRKPKPKATTVLSSDLQLHTPHTHARRGRTVHTVESRKRVLAHKLKFPASLISKFKFEGRFEEISASPS